jgi:hypothetical protein
LHGIGWQFYVVIPKPLEGLTYTPPLPELDEHKLQGFMDASIVMKGNLPHGIENITDGKPFE